MYLFIFPGIAFANSVVTLILGAVKLPKGPAQQPAL